MLGLRTVNNMLQQVNSKDILKPNLTPGNFHTVVFNTEILPFKYLKGFLQEECQYSVLIFHDFRMMDVA